MCNVVLPQKEILLFAGRSPGIYTFRLISVIVTTYRDYLERVLHWNIITLVSFVTEIKWVDIYSRRASENILIYCRLFSIFCIILSGYICYTIIYNKRVKLKIFKDYWYWIFLQLTHIIFFYILSTIIRKFYCNFYFKM